MGPERAPEREGRQGRTRSAARGLDLGGRRRRRVDALAAESLQFDNAYVEGMPTLPCRTAFFTGRFTFPFRSWGPLLPADVLLSELLRDQGYRTAWVTDTYHMLKPGSG